MKLCRLATFFAVSCELRVLVTVIVVSDSNFFAPRAGMPTYLYYTVLGFIGV
jgi:hypothetical protein